MLTASAQKQGKLVYYIALEPYDQARACQFGVNPNKLLLGEFPQAEQSLDTIIDFSRKKLVDLIILDSIHSLSPKGEQEDKKGEKSVGDDTMALLARKLSQFFRMAIDPVKRGEVAVVLIGQTRIGLNGIFAIEQLSGGNALHHYSKGIVHIKKGQKADAPTEKKATGDLTKSGNKSYESVQIGFDCVLKVDKCQIDGMASEGSAIHLPYYYDTGFYLPERLKKEIEQEEAEIKAQEDGKTGG
jgi:RecA/RadA recombinase